MSSKCLTYLKDNDSMKKLHTSVWGCGLFPIMHCALSAKMASDGEDVLAIEDQDERKPAAVSFGFTKTISKFKSSNKDEKEYLTTIDKHLLQR